MQAQIIPTASGDATLQFSYKGTYRHIPVNDILFIESRERKCFLHLSDSSKEEEEITSTEALCFYGKLNDIAEKLYPYGFIRCHQSYLISITSNIRYNDNQIYIEKARIPVSDRYRKNVLNIFRQAPINTSGNYQKITTGALVCIEGAYYGTIIRMYPNVSCSIGRDRQSSEIIFNLPYISRSHCDLIYRQSGNYEIKDHSRNGTYLIQSDGSARKLTADKSHQLPAGSIICFGDISLKFRLI